MSDGRMPTLFAPAERASLQELQHQSELFERYAWLTDVMAGVPDIFMVLNQYRQIVFANRAVFRQLNIMDKAAMFGLRPGEALDCVHASESDGGCGTTEFCRECGAVHAIMNSLGGRECVQECRIARRNGDALDLRVSATPVTLEDQEFVMFAVNDISNEKRRRVLERLFFHDILNTAGGMLGIAEILRDASADELEDLKSIVLELSERLVEEIRSQQILAAAEGGDLAITPQEISIGALFEETVEVYSHHEVIRHRSLKIDPASEDVSFKSDRNLARRVIGNMTKNALEGSAPGETVTLSAVHSGGEVRISVHNPGVMPRSVQLQIFQRSFSTKGAGRGLGTYSIKLFSERFLHGRAFFTSTPEDGTTFTVVYPVEWPAAA